MERALGMPVRSLARSAARSASDPLGSHKAMGSASVRRFTKPAERASATVAGQHQGEEWSPPHCPAQAAEVALLCLPPRRGKAAARVRRRGDRRSLRVPGDRDN